jgi:hypothetical protein
VSLRIVKRFLVFASEAGVLLGFIGSCGVAFLVAWLSGSSDLGVLAFYAGWLFAAAGVMLCRRKNQLWRIEYDAVSYQRSKAERELHPARLSWKKTLLRTGIWLPSAFAAMVLFFFPVVSHLVYPTSHYLRRYRVPIPWAATVFSQYGLTPTLDGAEAISSGSPHRQFGVTPFFDHNPRYSIMRFWNYTPSAYADHTRAPMPQDAINVRIREFRVGARMLTCRQYQHALSNPFQQRLMGTERIWEVVCGMVVVARGPNFRAQFYGREDEMPVFYEIVERVTPVE